VFFVYGVDYVPALYEGAEYVVAVYCFFKLVEDARILMLAVCDDAGVKVWCVFAEMAGYGNLADAGARLLEVAVAVDAPETDGLTSDFSHVNVCKLAA